ncbi:Pc22g23240 [Penicillium rubens Wisconsin 54-1255]|uniref:Pc22g23240 protein n=1 Tax=Penicillium rubens (strain ATCC 28089 / DSM 1075 / NRRL 1951 / Wisconsin 54-1255) TaxID=500485 RepID=B6HVG9_PENRW|nr:Pc22g23240 [Penicillium rubens Wisconsin 54-1255]
MGSFDTRSSAWTVCSTHNTSIHASRYGSLQPPVHIYPALVRGEPFQPLDGLAYEIRLREHWDRLRAYHPAHYDLVPGVCFPVEGDPEELRHGGFSLKTWLQERNLNQSNDSRVHLVLIKVL